ncbi:hypothetical protein CONLIGDRAFT_685404 [Coniochaeta ligniaria NRRL 30616]|uniref:WD-like domain-containing protein n=1 Tax=Coniochaeta ligniaria NRRL 30616 TaxID=1408157 RepID=A0A1J7ITJ4_9PEZI|nr:hypothetical protein CONLIGDRAFT_685404 [Coniochaeta ligniaria NRRL 30616]
MHFTKTTVLAILSATSTIANQLDAGTTTTELVELYSEVFENATFTWYGLEDGDAASNAAPALERRQCANGPLECDNSHSYGDDAYLSLQYYLSSDAGGALQKSPRAVCRSSDGGKCCASWGSVPQWGITKGDLLPAMNRIYNACYVGNSGLVRQADLGGSCITICLSDRESGCR